MCQNLHTWQGQPERGLFISMDSEGRCCIYNPMVSEHQKHSSYMLGQNLKVEFISIQGIAEELKFAPVLQVATPSFV